jgi:hypothetical protein
MTRSGRSALVLALELLGVRPGDGVLVPTYHCPTMIAPVERLGAKPVFYPLDSGGLPDMRFLGTLDLSRVRAMLVAHLFGIPQSLHEMAAFCRPRGISMIEDCAHCWFGSAGDTAVGTTGDFAIGSLTKFFPVMEGGLLASARRPIKPVAERSGAFVKELRALWDMVDMSSRAHRLGVLGYVIRGIARGRNFVRRRTSGEYPAEASGSEEIEDRGRALQDPLLDPMRLTRIESWVVEHSDAVAAIEGRRRTYNELAAGLADLPGVRLLWPRCHLCWAPYVMPLLVEANNDAYAKMRRMRLPVFRWDRLWPGTPRIDGDTAPVWASGMVQIACHQSLEGNAQELVSALRRCLTAGR